MADEDLSEFLRINPSLGGKARAASLTPAQRSAIAKQAADARWKRNVPTATHNGVLELFGSRLECAVLADGTRVIQQSDIMEALGRERSSGRKAGSEFPPFLATANLQTFVSKHLRETLRAIEFRIPGHRFISTGFEADLLPEICEVYLAARADEDTRLSEQQKKYAANAEVLMRALARVGIVALVDEATGYQASRENQDLQRLLAEYVDEAFRPWVGRFPDEFFSQVMRIYGHGDRPKSNRRPQFIGRFINEYIYRQFPEGVLDELQRVNPTLPSGRRSRAHHQHLTEGTGNTALDRQITAVVTLMAVSDNVQQFKDVFARRFPKQREILAVRAADNDLGMTKLWDEEDFS